MRRVGPSWQTSSFRRSDTSREPYPVTAARERPPNRRASEQIAFTYSGFRFIATVSRFFDGRLAEIFLTNGKCGFDSDVSARDADVIASIALQHGVPIEVLCKALMRDRQGQPSGPLAMMLGLLVGEAN
jgi:hypothetical protein